MSVVSVKLCEKAAVPLTRAAACAGSRSPLTSTRDSSRPPAFRATARAARALGSLIPARAMPRESSTHKVACSRTAEESFVGSISWMN